MLLLAAAWVRPSMAIPRDDGPGTDRDRGLRRAPRTRSSSSPPTTGCSRWSRSRARCTRRSRCCWRAAVLRERLARSRQLGIVIARRRRRADRRRRLDGEASSTPEQSLEPRDRLGAVAVEDRGHPDRLGAGAVLAQVVDEDRGGGLDREPLAGEQVDLRLGLVQADLAGDHGGVEEVGRARGRRSPGPMSSRSARSSRPPPAPPATAPTIASSGLEVGEHVGRSAPRARRRRAARRSAARTRRRRARRSPGRAAASAPRCRRETAPGPSPGARPSASQKAANAGQMLVVSTPPKSTTRAIGSPAMGEEATARGDRRARRRGVVRGQRRGGRAAAPLRADLRRALEPHLRGHRRRRPPLGAAPPAARQAPRLGPRHGPRVPDHLGAAGDPGPGRARGRPLARTATDPFYVMDWVDGPDPALAAADVFPDPDDRRAIGERVVDTLVAIHAVDPDDVGLGELAKKEDYVARQLHRWQGQWQKQHTRELPLVDEVHDRLAARIPEQGPATIVHGDYRLDNMILTAVGRGRGGRRLGAVHARRPARRRRPAARLLGRGRRRAACRCSSRRRWRRRLPVPRRGRERYAERSGRDLSEIDFYVALGALEARDHPRGRLRPLRGGPVRRRRGDPRGGRGRAAGQAASDAEGRLG